MVMNGLVQLKGHTFTLYVGCTGMEMNGLLVGD